MRRDVTFDKSAHNVVYSKRAALKKQFDIFKEQFNSSEIIDDGLEGDK